MREHERTLHQDIEKCFDKLQEIVDTEATRSISVFSKKTSDNDKWLQELKGKFLLRDDLELQELQNLRDDQMNQIKEIEAKIEYYEKLCNELEEFQSELEVKTKLEQKRRSRMNSIHE